MASQRGRGKVEKTPRPRKKPANVKAAKRKAARKKATQKKAAQKAGQQRGAAAGSSTAPGGRRTADPSAGDHVETRFVQPYDAVKTYRCPGCNRDIPAGQGHIVAVPPEAPDLRRHWHRGCWANRHNLG